MEKYKRILFLGFRCAGKTTISKKLSNIMNIPLIDIDEEIEKKQGKTITEITNNGENWVRFRELELKKLGEVLKIDNIIPEHIDALLSKLEEMGVELEVGADYAIVSRPEKYKATSIKTAVYPGFATDLQQPFTVLLTQSNGKSKVTETIFENRFMHVPYLSKLGADITVKNQTATIIGPNKLVGTDVVATDLRAGATMVAAALLAEGKTTITSAEHILRGYENIVEKLTDVGAKIEIKEI